MTGSCRCLVKFRSKYYIIDDAGLRWWFCCFAAVSGRWCLFVECLSAACFSDVPSAGQLLKPAIIHLSKNCTVLPLSLSCYQVSSWLFDAKYGLLQTVTVWSIAPQFLSCFRGQKLLWKSLYSPRALARAKYEGVIFGHVNMIWISRKNKSHCFYGFTLFNHGYFSLCRKVGFHFGSVFVTCTCNFSIMYH